MICIHVAVLIQIFNHSTNWFLIEIKNHTGIRTTRVIDIPDLLADNSCARMLYTTAVLFSIWFLQLVMTDDRRVKVRVCFLSHYLFTN